MAHYVVSYDLHQQRAYVPVWTYLESLKATRLLESLWVVSSNLSAAQIREQVTAKGDNDDSFAVIELKPGASWSTMRAKQPGVDWLKRNIAA